MNIIVKESGLSTGVGQTAKIWLSDILIFSVCSSASLLVVYKTVNFVQIG